LLKNYRSTLRPNTARTYIDTNILHTYTKEEIQDFYLPLEEDQIALRKRLTCFGVSLGAFSNELRRDKDLGLSHDSENEEFVVDDSLVSSYLKGEEESSTGSVVEIRASNVPYSHSNEKRPSQLQKFVKNSKK